MSEIDLSQNYVGFKLIGLDYFIWFETNSVIQNGNILEGYNGWGCENVKTHIKINKNQLVSVISTSELPK